MKRSKLLLVAVVAGLVAVLWNVRQVEFARRAVFQPAPDYDALEVDRSREVAHARPESTWPTPTWTDFRGPGRAGVYVETPIRTAWPAEGLRELWRQPVGAGYGAVTIANGRVLALEQRRDDEALVAYDLGTGDELWSVRWPTRYSDAFSGEGPRSTPVQFEGVAYVLGATGELRAVATATHTTVWRTNVLELSGSSNLEYGLAASPLVVGELLLVPTGEPGDGVDAASLLALSRADGSVVWRALAERASYSSPLLATLQGVEVVLLATATRLVVLDPGTGALLGSHPWAIDGGFTCSQPVVLGDDRVLLSGGYGMGSTVVDVALANGVWTLTERWRSRRYKTRFDTSFPVGEHVYGLDEGILACLDPRTGERVWKDGRYGYGQMLLAKDHLVVLGETGELVLVRVSPQALDERARFQALDELSMNPLAAAHGRLFVRNKLELVCYELWPEEAD